MKIIITESQYNLLFETKSVNAAQTLIDMAVEDYIDACSKMKAFQNIQLALCKGFENGTVKLEVTSVEKKENDRFEDNIFYIIHLILYVDKEWMLENSYYEKFETTLAIKIGNILGTFEYYCYIDEVRINDEIKDNLNESEKESPKNQRLIKQMWFDGYSKEDIQNYTGIDRGEFYTILKDEKQGIDCPEANQIIMDMTRKTNLINKNIDLTKFNYKEGSLELSYGFGYILEFIYKDSSFHIEGFATPYWDDCVLPVDIRYFENIETKEYNDEYDELQMRVKDELIPKKFNSYQEIIDFMNNVYPGLIVPKIKNSIPHYLDRISN
jgi:hypothetical protein